VTQLTTVADIWPVVEDYLAAEHLELDDVELSGRGPATVLRIVVDGKDVDIDRLAEVSRGVSRLLDNSTELDDPYRLEVSSPGLERKLRLPSHFAKSVGREVVAKITVEGGKTTVRGVIADAGERSFTVEAEGESQVVNYEDVLTANTVFRWEKAPKPGH
jgi:ribosome maturation factor RimP